MMALPSGGRGPLKAMLAGIFLSCILQPAQAQNNFSVTKEPEYPKVGQQVTLIPRGVLGQITHCTWFRDSASGPSGDILSYGQFNEQDLKSRLSKNFHNGSAYTGRETLYPNCSLHIQKLTLRDTGNYTVEIETVDQKSRQLEQSIYLQIEDPAQQINIIADQQFPKPGQNVILKPQVNLRQFTSCVWSIQTHPGHLKPIFRQVPEQVKQVDAAYSGRVTIGDACSLQISQLKTTDTNNYTVTIRAPLQQPGQPQHPQWPQQPGQRGHGQGEHDQEYTGHVYLNIAEPHTGTKGGSASSRYSAGLIAGGLLGSLAWADSLMSPFSVLLGSLASWRSKLFL